MRAIARFTGANIIGINNNSYQIQRAIKQTAEANLSKQCSFIEADFMELPFANDSIDCAYAIEATCHAPDKVACYREILRVLKPGAVFVGCEWVMTAKYDPSNAHHRKVKKALEEGDSLPDIPSISEVLKALRDAGFEVEEHEDMGTVTPRDNVTWYATLDHRGVSLKNFRQSKLGTTLTKQIVRVLEFMRLAPRGSTRAHDLLLSAVYGLVNGGRLGVRILNPVFAFQHLSTGLFAHALFQSPEALSCSQEQLNVTLK